LRMTLKAERKLKLVVLARRIEKELDRKEEGKIGYDEIMRILKRTSKNSEHINRRLIKVSVKQCYSAMTPSVI
jgi:hypothetical protein